MRLGGPVAGAVLLCSALALAAAESNRWALVVGVDKCAAIGELKVCAADARALAAQLAQVGYAGSEITVLADDSADLSTWPTIGNVKRRLEILAEGAGPEDSILFFFSGHGVTRDGEGYLVPSDGDARQAIALKWVKSVLAASKAGRKTIILDACHAGAAKGVSGIVPGAADGGDIAMLLSCDRDQVSWPDESRRLSAFTAKLLQGLAGGADKNRDGRVTVAELSDYVKEGVKNWTMRNGKALQTPITAGGASDQVLAVVANVPPIPPVGPGPTTIPRQWRSPTSGMEFTRVDALKLWVGKYEVTNEQYRRRDPDHSSQSFKGVSLNGPLQPVVYVSFDDAKAYAEWLTEKDRLEDCRYRLISEDEWQVCAQGGERWEYPWGNSFPPKCGNYSDMAAKTSFSNWTAIKGYVDGYSVSCPVDRSGVNPLGLFGLGGNVWECCASDATGESFGAWCGGSWTSYDPSFIRCACRESHDGGSLRDNSHGFRLVMTSPSAGSGTDEQKSTARLRR